jgi:sugar-specific transcriptional regulator TrmB
MEAEKLVRLGLTGGEAGVYLALLESGPSTVGPVVKKSGVAYSNIYEILERLMKKGLVSFIVKSKTKYFQAAEPLRLHDYLERKEREIKKERKLVEQLIPVLSALSRRKGEKLEAEVFTGFKGMNTAYEKILADYSQDDDYIFFYGPVDKNVQRVDRFFINFEKRVYKKLGVRMRGVVSKDYFMLSNYVKRSIMIKKGLWELRHVNFPVPGNIDVYRDRLLIVSWSGPMIAVLIHSNEIAGMFLKYFESAWKIAKKC